MFGKQYERAYRSDFMRYRTRSDANQKEIDKALRAIGATVQPLGSVGAGCPDRLVGFRGTTFLLETKNREGYAARKSEGKTEAQIKWHQLWQGKPVAIVFNVDDALEAIGAK